MVGMIKYPELLREKCLLYYFCLLFPVLFLPFLVSSHLTCISCICHGLWIYFLSIPCHSVLVIPGHFIPSNCSLLLVITCHSLSFLVIPCHSLSFLVIPCHSLSFLAIPYHSLSFLVIPCHSLSFLVIPCHSLLFLASSCHCYSFLMFLVIPCHSFWFPAIPCHFSPLP
jgi:hypothetical protein